MQLLYFLLLVTLSLQQKCQRPPAAPHFTGSAYLGQWYQIGKYQTAGGAFFQRDCHCTEMLIGQTANNLYAYQTCIRKGKTVGVNATLLPAGDPGQFVEQIGVNRVGYWVIQLDEETAVEYDCQQSPIAINYCVHIMARGTSLPQEKIDALKKYAEGLNTHHLDFQMTDQITCRNQLITQ